MRKDWQNPEAVIFDLDGLVLDSERVYCQSWCQAAARMGYALMPETYMRRFVGVASEPAEAELAAEFGPEFSTARFHETWQRLFHEHIRTQGIPPKPGVLELLDWLAVRTMPRAVATATPRPDALLSLGALAPRFDAIVGGDQIAHPKPAPDVYLAAAAALSVRPTRCLALEDSENGARSALSAGMTVFLVPDVLPPSAEIVAAVHNVCSSLLHVRDLLAAAADGTATPASDRLRVRRYTDGDARAVWDLHNLALTGVGAHAGNGPWDDDLHHIPDVYLRAGGEFLVGLLGTRVVAMGAIKRLGPDRAELTRMRVHPAFQRRGCGRRMLERLEARARKLGFTRLELETTARQYGAQALYRRHGYTETGRRKQGVFEVMRFVKAIQGATGSSSSSSSSST